MVYFTASRGDKKKNKEARMLSTWVVCGVGLAHFALLLVVDVSANADVDLRQIKPASLVNICQGWSKEGHLPAEILLEDTDGLRRPPFYNPSVTSRCGSPLLLLTCALLMTSSHAEGRTKMQRSPGSKTGRRQRACSALIPTKTCRPTFCQSGGGYRTRRLRLACS